MPEEGATEVHREATDGSSESHENNPIHHPLTNHDGYKDGNSGIIH
jgi:hypothetical protein